MKLLRSGEILKFHRQIAHRRERFAMKMERSRWICIRTLSWALKFIVSTFFWMQRDLDLRDKYGSASEAVQATGNTYLIFNYYYCFKRERSAHSANWYFPPIPISWIVFSCASRLNKTKTTNFSAEWKNVALLGQQERERRFKWRRESLFQSHHRKLSSSDSTSTFSSLNWASQTNHS